MKISCDAHRGIYASGQLKSASAKQISHVDLCTLVIASCRRSHSFSLSLHKKSSPCFDTKLLSRTSLSFFFVKTWDKWKLLSWVVIFLCQWVNYSRIWLIFNVHVLIYIYIYIFFFWEISRKDMELWGWHLTKLRYYIYKSSHQLCMNSYTFYFTLV